MVKVRNVLLEQLDLLKTLLHLVQVYILIDFGGEAHVARPGRLEGIFPQLVIIAH